MMVEYISQQFTTKYVLCITLQIPDMGITRIHSLMDCLLCYTQTEPFICSYKLMHSDAGGKNAFMW